MLQPLGT